MKIPLIVWLNVLEFGLQTADVLFMHQTQCEWFLLQYFVLNLKRVLVCKRAMKPSTVCWELVNLWVYPPILFTVGLDSEESA